MKINTVKLQKLINKVTEFNKARGWKPVSADSAKAIVIEAAELLEHFQWDESDSKKNLGEKAKEKDWEEIKAELADILWYIITFCNETGIDLVEALEEKIKRNEEKYPKEKFTGKHNPEFYKKQKRKYRKNRGK